MVQSASDGDSGASDDNTSRALQAGPIRIGRPLEAFTRCWPGSPRPTPWWALSSDRATRALATTTFRWCAAGSRDNTGTSAFEPEQCVRHGRGPKRPARRSMGPTSLDVGGSRPSRSRRLNALQWGRHLSMSEGRGARAGDWKTMDVDASTAADISRCRRLECTRRELERLARLQWGRHLSMSLERHGKQLPLLDGLDWTVPLHWGRHLSMSRGTDDRRRERIHAQAGRLQ